MRGSIGVVRARDNGGGLSIVNARGVGLLVIEGGRDALVGIGDQGRGRRTGLEIILSAQSSMLLCWGLSMALPRPSSSLLGACPTTLSPLPSTDILSIGDRDPSAHEPTAS